MKRKTIAIAALATAGIVAGGAALYRAGVAQGGQNAATPASDSRSDPAGGRKVLYWHDPMVPGPKFDKPGKSPFMDMALVPVYADQSGDDGKVAISPRIQQNLGIRTAPVEQGALAASLTVVGNISFNERDTAMVQARAGGYVERLLVRAPLDAVRRGQPLVELYVPDWVAAQEEYLAARRMSAELGDAARQRMRLAGMDDLQIRAVETTGKVHARLAVASPMAGVVTELAVREGMTVAAGAPLYRINGTSAVWLIAEVPETAAAQVRPGQNVAARVAALPGMAFSGKVEALLPEVNPSTRTLKARIVLANPDGRLVQGMFATADLAGQTGAPALLVPTEAVIRTGTRSVVFVAAGAGGFAPVDVETGAEAGGRTEIRKGLVAGQQVVVSGQFLVDSEASLKGVAARMAADTPVGGPVHHATGRVEKIDAGNVTLSHGPVATLQWGPMTMPFKLPQAGLPPGMTVGAMVSFDFVQLPDGGFQVTAMTPATAGGGK
ncbi:efflux RND transporter periplasmic adaptor subunit [Duganella sp. FT92W]|uniref:Efflux RND transporter periplasmic adaptor subunit n=1 Tax=Pseudoduganella rivuli TaxID=2666085 RepID=A0A7X2LRZ2_9BURK|nr:efflux RND transporter periplasmic adaptor subunit [Pseudoduganella rivuli]MRV71746.1 efflux RND transporter periplasmic adaptor subunit [Pseudoduganella rivuli]